VRGPLAGQHGHLALAVHADCVISGWERVDAVEVVALYPILQLARLVAGVGAYFKHGHHDDLHLNRSRLGGRKRGKG